MTKREVEEYIMSQIYPNPSHEVTAQNVRNAFAPIVEQVWTYLEGRIGDLSQLQTADKSSVVSAINAVLGKMKTDIDKVNADIATLGSKVGELDRKNSNITTENTESEEEAIVITTDAGVQVGKIDENGADFKNLKSNGKDVLAEVNKKQDALIAGKNITIGADGKTISAEGGVGDLPITKEVATSEEDAIIFETDNGAQVGKIDGNGADFKSLSKDGKSVLTTDDKLVEGKGIHIEGNVISSTGGVGDLPIETETITEETDRIEVYNKDGDEVLRIDDSGVKAIDFCLFDNTSIASIDYGKRNIGCVKYQPIETGCINHIVEYGQSLSIGGASIAITTRSIDRCYMLGNSVKDYSSDVLTPLRNLDGTDTEEAITTGEDMIVPAIHCLKYLAEQSGIKADFLGTSSGNGGTTIDQLSKVSSSGDNFFYRHFLSHISNARKASENVNKTIVCPAIMYVQGESDYSSSKAYSAQSQVFSNTEEGYRAGIDYYKTKLIQLKNDMQADIMSTYQQTLRPLFFVHAVGSGNQCVHGAVVNMAQIEACAENDDMILVGAPTFAPRSDVHLTGNGYRWWSEFFAKVMFQSLVQNYKFEAIQPISFKAIGKKLYIKHKVVCPPLVIDKHTVSDIRDCGYRIYKVKNGGFVAEEIRSIRVLSCEVVIELSNKISGTYEINYAGIGSSSIGNVCDSDTWHTCYEYEDDSVNTYSSTGEINYRPKDEKGNFIFGRCYPMQNWSVPYSKIINF